MENIVASAINAQYYWRENDKEIDFLSVNGKKIIPIEVKNKQRVAKNELKSMKYFLNKYNTKEGLIIYHGKEEEKEFNDSKIKFIPLWQWLLNK